MLAQRCTAGGGKETGEGVLVRDMGVADFKDECAPSVCWETEPGGILMLEHIWHGEGFSKMCFKKGIKCEGGCKIGKKQ